MASSKEPLTRAEKIPRGPDSLKRSKCIAAIDFGTSSLSVAYTTPTDDQIRLVPLHNTYERVPNSILIAKNQGKDEGQKQDDQNEEQQQYTVTGIGYKAQTMYSNVANNAEKYIYFERIKKLLGRDQSLDRTTEDSSFTGGSYYLIEVIAFILTHLKKMLLTDHLKGDYKSSDFDWVITVPAIWKARARRMMREAAYMAGLTSDAPGITKFTPVGSPLPRPEEVNPEKLSLALEPEVAAIAAQRYSEVSGTPPQRYMVVDIGGGTVDITVHDKSNGGISVVLPSTGNTWGGTTVNEALSELLQKAVDDKGFESFIKSDASNKAEINKLVFEDFEEQKKIFGDVTPDIDNMVLELPRPFIRNYGGNVIGDGMKQEKVHYDHGEGALEMKYDQLEKKVFKPTIDKIIECVRAAFDELKHDRIDTVYLVGGFGGCKFVSQKIQEAIAQHRGKLYDNIVCPVEPDLAVVRGAVMWRKDPSIIQSRVADATYGTAISDVFNPSIHDEHYKFLKKNGVEYCRDVLKVFVLKGEVVKDEVYKAGLILGFSQKITQQCITIYCTAADGVQYTKNKKGKLMVRKIGELVLDIPNPDNLPRNKRGFDVFMDFSGTEIQARARYRITGKEVKTVCDFLTKQD
ncbi:PREDICTED: heat shock 70 kDa protein 12A-like [Amphimedon queenslandica]|uniref:Uncharacterized protein n=1 Tax=Amphimedon queenslandica TaxID=400682 RepID=A0A1X7TL65_AMPQE|nr:PREDICTED: heat shock 70 kDa protein 12A-like [Amphimedon queenslandica]|eukprot:XP_019859066.1 PREDICTED: heat shock 70 kDa protein 12A-like [Amphimedon queenslandica]